LARRGIRSTWSSCISTLTADVIIAETGADMTRFPRAGQLASLAGTTPGNNESAGKVKSSRTRPGNPYLQGALGAYRGQSSDGIGQQEAFDEAPKVPLLVMKGVRVEPCYTQSYQTGRQRDPFDSNQFEQVVNRRERVVGTGRNEDIVAFKDIQVWLGYLNQSPGQVGLELHFPASNLKDSNTLVVRALLAKGCIMAIAVSSRVARQSIRGAHANRVCLCRRASRPCT
jgi:hypothetical protein